MNGGVILKLEGLYAGLSVKQILTEKLGFSKRAIASLKSRDDGILLNGKRVTVRAIVDEGDVLEINLDDESTQNEKLIPSSTLPEIVFEDEYIVAANKPPFMPTHQSQGHFYDTLANSLAYYYSSKDRPFVFRSVNRLDRNTSGVVLVAKDRLTSSKLSAQMKSDGIKKTYLAILDGELECDSGTISTYIRRREKSIILREVCDKSYDAKLAITEYEVLARANGYCLVSATPVTGRTHQLRVHFAHLGSQILGDDLYGLSSPIISRHALHAESLTFTHPENGVKMTLKAKIPDDMEHAINEIFGKEALKLYEQ